MNFELQTTSYFDSEAKKLAKRHRSFIDDLQGFRDSLLANPYQGVEMSPGIRKIRLTIDSKARGKSGGARVITFTYLVNEKDGVVILPHCPLRSPFSGSGGAVPVLGWPAISFNSLTVFLKDAG